MNAPTKFDLRKDEIISAATALLNHKGVRGMTLPLVAAQLDLAPRAVSYYFRHKEDLAAACYRRSVERMTAHVAYAAAKTETAERIGAFVEAFFEDQYKTALGELPEIAWFEDMRTIQDADVGASYTDMFRQVRALLDEPGKPRRDPRERNARAHHVVSQMLWAVLWLPRYNPEDYRRMGERTADILLHGLAAPGQRWSFVTLPRGKEGDDAAPAFLRAATDMINEHGYLGASVNKISACLKVSKGSFYHHNGAKDDLVEQCFVRTWSILRETQIAADEAASSGFMNLASQAVSLVGGQACCEVPLLRTSALAAAPEEMRPRLMAGFDRTTARYESVVSDGIVDGSIRPLDAAIAAQVAAGAINAAAELKHWAPGVDSEMAETFYVRPIFMGLLS